MEDEYRCVMDHRTGEKTCQPGDPCMLCPRIPCNDPGCLGCQDGGPCDHKSHARRRLMEFDENESAKR